MRSYEKLPHEKTLEKKNLITDGGEKKVRTYVNTRCLAGGDSKRGRGWSLKKNTFIQKSSLNH